MTDKPTKPEPAGTAAPDAETETTPRAAQPDLPNFGEGAEAPAEATAQAIAALEAEKADLKDRMLRTLAEMENLRRRTEREIADARAYGITAFARDILTVADNMQRALEAIPVEARSEGAVKAIFDGVEITERDLLKTLERHGVKKIEPQGQKFDPNLHQAMFEVPDTSVPNGTVVQVVQSGFVIGERVLRPALVGVSKGGPKANGPNGGGGEQGTPTEGA